LQSGSGNRSELARRARSCTPFDCLCSKPALLPLFGYPGGGYLGRTRTAGGIGA
jgi:hypothetical protein